MGLFKSISRFVRNVAETAGGLVSTVASAITPLARIAAPVVQTAIAARGLSSLLPRPPLGVQGGQSPIANPIARAQIFPAFNPATIPNRPLAAQNAQLAALQQFFGQQQQTTSFNQGAFGASIAPGFRPFSPSFRSGGFGSSGGFQPGISRGLAPQFDFGQFQQPQFQQFQQFQQPRVQGFGGVGSFGGFQPQPQFGFGGFAPQRQQFGGAFGGFGGFQQQPRGFGGFGGFGGFSRFGGFF